MRTIVITGRIPSKKNSRIHTRTGMSFPSAKYTAWHKDASAQLVGQTKIPDGTSLTVHFYFPDNRRTDLSNKVESIMDLLVDNGILTDDCWQIIPSLSLLSMGVDKNSPRAEIIC